MAYKTYNEMVAEHLAFLRSHGLDVKELNIDAGFIRCREIGCTKGRGELSYKVTTSVMSNGTVGLATWCRGVGGVITFQSYGLAKIEEQTALGKPPLQESSSERYESAAKKAYGFWKNSQLSGSSDYLIRKGVGSYGIRFRNNEYGRVAVIPMIDAAGKLWSYQLLNPDGTKRFPKDSRMDGLFHCLGAIENGKPFGIAESYVTAATCFELTNLPMVCAFSCQNLLSVATALRSKYPHSPIILFADNDRHLPNNQGVMKVEEVCAALRKNIIIAIPSFKASEPCKAASDWNDLVAIEGKEEVLSQLQQVRFLPCL